MGSISVCVPGFLVANPKVGLKCSHSSSACCASSARLLGSGPCRRGRKFVLQVGKGSQGQALKDRIGGEGYPVCINRNGCWNRSLCCHVGEEQAARIFPGSGWRCLGWKHNEPWRHTMLCASPGVPGSCFSVNLDTKEGHGLGSPHSLKFTNHIGYEGTQSQSQREKLFVCITEWSPL